MLYDFSAYSLIQMFCSSYFTTNHLTYKFSSLLDYGSHFWAVHNTTSEYGEAQTMSPMPQDISLSQLYCSPSQY